MHRQIDRCAYAHTAFFTTEVAEELAATLVARAPAGITAVYLVSGGSEAMETALKLARQYVVEGGESAAFSCSSGGARATTATRWARWPSAATNGAASPSRRC